MTQVIDQRHDFYAMAGGAGAVLVGLLFTSMALRTDQSGAGSAAFERDLWTAAGIPLASFLDIVLLAMSFLAPAQTALGLGLPLLGLAVLFTSALLPLWTRSWSIPRSHVRRELVLAHVGYIAQGAVAVAVLQGVTSWLWVLAVTVGGLILNASLAAWDLLRLPILARMGPAPARSRPADGGDRREHNSPPT